MNLHKIKMFINRVIVSIQLFFGIIPKIKVGSIGTGKSSLLLRPELKELMSEVVDTQEEEPMTETREKLLEVADAFFRSSLPTKIGNLIIMDVQADCTYGLEQYLSINRLSFFNRHLKFMQLNSKFKKKNHADPLDLMILKKVQKLPLEEVEALIAEISNCRDLVNKSLCAAIGKRNEGIEIYFESDEDLRWPQITLKDKMALKSIVTQMKTLDYPTKCWYEK